MAKQYLHLRTFIFDINPKPLELYLARPSWVRLNRLRTGVDLFRSTVHRWGIDTTAASECGEEQTADHIPTFCPIFYHPSRGLGPELVDEETVAWLNSTCLRILRVLPKETSTSYKED